MPLNFIHWRLNTILSVFDLICMFLTSSRPWTDCRGCSFRRRLAWGGTQRSRDGSPERRGRCTVWRSLTCGAYCRLVSLKDTKWWTKLCFTRTWSECGSCWWCRCVHNRARLRQTAWRRSLTRSTSAEIKDQNICELFVGAWIEKTLERVLHGRACKNVKLYIIRLHYIRFNK